MPATNDYDVIVAGLGAMGSAAAFHLARRGQRVLGLDRFAPPHSMGSSHGQTRIIREAYFEHPIYVPMVQRAYELWAELERDSQASLLRITGGLMLGLPDSAVVAGSRRSAETHGLPHELLSAKQVRERFPALRPCGEMMAVWEPRAGILFPEQCIAAHLALATRHGAALHFNEPVLRWEPERAGVRVWTARGEYHARRLIVSAGAWASTLLRDLDLPLQVERQVLFWFTVRGKTKVFSPDHCPIHLWQFNGTRFFYGFPDLGAGVKIAFHHDGETTTADTVNREVGTDEVKVMREVVERFVPTANGQLRSATVCLYTNTPDDHFWIDRHPEHAQVLIASPCSGHGFKFSPTIGEILAKLACGEDPGFDLKLFRRR